MDDRDDEQERGITLKSSAISLYYQNGNVVMILSYVIFIILILQTTLFEVNVGVHQGSVLSSLLLAIVVDVVANKIKRERYKKYCTWMMYS